MNLIKTLASSNAKSIDDIAQSYNTNLIFKNTSIKLFHEWCVGSPIEDLEAFLEQQSQFLSGISDQGLNNEFYKRYNLQSAAPIISKDSGTYISKVNHGFWEHVAYLHSSTEDRISLRDVNLNLRKNQYLQNSFLLAMMTSWFRGQEENTYQQYVSLTSGIAPFNKVFPKSENLIEGSIKNVQKGAVKGLILASDLFKISHQCQQNQQSIFTINDSYIINKTFEQGHLLNNLKENHSPDSTCMIFGPPHLSNIRLKKWPGKHSFLALSETRAMEFWLFNLASMAAAIDDALENSEKILILFQGAVLSPIMCAFLSSQEKILKNRISFIDLGRLLDVDAGVDLTKTGSPLPSRSTSNLGQFDITTSNSMAFWKESLS